MTNQHISTACLGPRSPWSGVPGSGIELDGFDEALAMLLGHATTTDD
jgi:hypothetical protein